MNGRNSSDSNTPLNNDEENKKLAEFNKFNDFFLSHISREPIHKYKEKEFVCTEPYYLEDSTSSSAMEAVPVIAYQYQTSYKIFDKAVGGNLTCIGREWFIPSLNISFNKDEVFRSREPRNRDTLYSHCPTILRKVLLPEEFVCEISDKLGESSRVSIGKLENSEIFDHPLDINFFASESDFENNYQLHGSLILPNYIMRYLCDMNLDKNSRTANRIFEVIDSLDELEKKSLETCLMERIRDHDDRKYNTRKSPVSLTTGMAAMTAGVATALIAESTPAGFFAGGLVLFGKKKYDELLKRRCEEFKIKIFGAIKKEQKESLSQKM